jgi:FkbM family methyltransferase
MMLKRLLDAHEINCVLDVGANRGQYASELRGIGFSGRIVSFEPVSSEFKALSDLFKDDTNWRGHQLALGSTDGSATIIVPRLTVLSSLRPLVKDEPGARTEVVEVRRLDRIFDSTIEGVPGPRVLLKMDTQGFDVEVFKGAGRCLDSICALQSEISIQPLYKGMPHYLEALRIYEEAGFELHDLTVVLRAGDGALRELNCFMVRPSHLV